MGVLKSKAKNEYAKSARWRSVEVEDWMRSVDSRDGQAARDRVEQIIAAFSKEQDVLDVIDRLSEGFNGPETQEMLGITEKRFAAIKRRIHRKDELFRR